MTNKAPFVTRKWRRLVARAWTERCPVWTPVQSYAFGNDPFSRFHRRALDLRRPKAARAKSVVYTLYWPLRAVLLVAVALPGVDRKALHIRAPIVSLFGMFWWLLVRHNIALESALKFRLWQPQSFARAREYIQNEEITVVMTWIGNHTPRTGIEVKANFSNLCADHGLPHAETVAVYRDGDPVGDRQSFPPGDLFSKQDGSYGGSDGRAWAYDSRSETWQNGQHRFDDADLDQHFRTMSEGDRLVVQVCLTNADSLMPVSNGYLCTSRVVAYQAPGEEPRILRAALRMPVGDNQVDNFVAGGLASIVDADGRLSPAIQKRKDTEIVGVHPDTGQAVTGFQIDNWTAVTDLARRAQATMTDLPSVGWDIALTPEGPKLVEANVGWCAEILQMPESEPLGLEFVTFIDTVAEARDALTPA